MAKWSTRRYRKPKRRWLRKWWKKSPPSPQRKKEQPVEDVVVDAGAEEGAEDPEVVDGDVGADVEMALHLNSPDGLPFPWCLLPGKA